MESTLAHLARKERHRLRLTRVDIDERPELARRFDVEDVPTLVLVSERQVVERLEGRASVPRIEAMLGRAPRRRTARRLVGKPVERS